MLTAREIIDIYISFFEKRGHKRIQNSPLVPIDDPTTLFTSSGMQPLVPFLLGEQHPSGTKLVDVQNCFRAVDIDEVGDNRHTTFFRMLGNWSLGDYFKTEQLPWFFEFLTKKLGLDPKKLFVTAFEGNEVVDKDEDSILIWNKLFSEAGLDPARHIYSYGVDKNWWSRSGTPDNMPAGEPGGPDSEVFFDLETEHDKKFGPFCHPNCDCGRFLEIGNSVFMQYQKEADGSFKKLPKANVDFGGGVERLLAAVENKSDIFQTSLFSPIIKSIEKEADLKYSSNEQKVRIIADHLRAAVYLIDAKVLPSNKDRGYLLRRLIRRALDNLGDANVENIVSEIVKECSKTDESLSMNFEEIKNVILEEETKYKTTQKTAKDFIIKKYGGGDDSAQPVREIKAEDAFLLYSTHGLSPTQIKSLGYIFDEQKFANLMEEHSKISKTTSAGMFKGGLADQSEQTIKGHTATHLLHQALRDVFGESLHQTGSNITSERIRFDFNFDRNLTDLEIKKIEDIVNEKIKENLPVHFEMLPLQKAKDLGAIGLFDEKYAKDVKVYFIGDYSKEFCGGPHVDFTRKINRFKIIKQENLGKGQKRIYAKAG